MLFTLVDVLSNGKLRLFVRSLDMERTRRVLFQVTAALAFLFLSEVLASLMTWHGKPMDATYEPSFWGYELLRLKYWTIFVLVALSVAALVYGTAPHLHRRTGFEHRGVRFILFLLLAALVSATEYVTSVQFRRSLPLNEAAYLGWSYAPSYVTEHLYSWAISGVLLLGMSFLVIRSIRWVRRSVVQ